MLWQRWGWRTRSNNSHRVTCRLTQRREQKVPWKPKLIVDSSLLGFKGGTVNSSAFRCNTSSSHGGGFMGLVSLLLKSLLIYSQKSKQYYKKSSESVNMHTLLRSPNSQESNPTGLGSCYTKTGRFPVFLPRHLTHRMHFYFEPNSGQWVLL